jgi:conjugal transfer ATP-binding protein TraC
VIVSVGVPTSKSVSNEDLKQTRDGLVAMLKSLNLGVVEVGPEALIAVIDDLTSPPPRRRTMRCPTTRMIHRLPGDPPRHRTGGGEKTHAARTERFRPTGKVNDGVPEIGTVYPDASMSGILPYATCHRAGPRGNARG